jgi:hypothetical protein
VSALNGTGLPELRRLIAAAVTESQDPSLNFDAAAPDSAASEPRHENETEDDRRAYRRQL